MYSCGDPFPLVLFVFLLLQEYSCYFVLCALVLCAFECTPTDATLRCACSGNGACWSPPGAAVGNKPVGRRRRRSVQHAITPLPTAAGCCCCCSLYPYERDSHLRRASIQNYYIYYYTAVVYRTWLSRYPVVVVRVLVQITTAIYDI